MSEISNITAGLYAKNALTQLNISTAVMKSIIDSEKQIANLLENLSKAPTNTASQSGRIDIYV